MEYSEQTKEEAEQIKREAATVWAAKEKEIVNKLPAVGRGAFNRFKHIFKEVFVMGFYHGGEYFETKANEKNTIDTVQHSKLDIQKRQ